MTTDTTVIQPGAGQSILTTDHRDHGHHGGHDHHENFRETRLDADYRSLSAEAQRNVMLTGDRINTVGAAGALASGHTDQLMGAGFGGVHDRLCDGFGSVTRAVTHGTEEGQENYAALQKQVSDTATATVVGFKESQGLAFQVEGRSLLEAAKNASAASVQATANFNAITVQATQNQYQILLDAQKNAAAAQLEAEKNQAATQLKFCECCHEIQSQADRNTAALQATAAANACELKALIISSTADIKGQAADFRMRDLEGRLNRIPTGVPVTIPVGL